MIALWVVLLVAVPALVIVTLQHFEFPPGVTGLITTLTCVVVALIILNLTATAAL